MLPMGFRGLLGLGSNSCPGPYKGESLPRYLRLAGTRKEGERGWGREQGAGSRGQGDGRGGRTGLKHTINPSDDNYNTQRY